MDDALRSFDGVLIEKPTNLVALLGKKSKAVVAWQRSVEVSKSDATSEAERAALFLQGTRLINSAFKANQKSAAVANALCEALKLAERTIQFADTLTVYTEGYLGAGRVSHAEGSLIHATKHYSSAVEGQPKHVVGAIDLAQIQMQNGQSESYRDEMAAAFHTLDTLLQPPNPHAPWKRQ
ncbi:hypothetical protein DXG01_010535 [Tephrocybe rancida]|nr:hypothetical protein DXG01_010535 [Tephrocybe rancida]